MTISFPARRRLAQPRVGRDGDRCLAAAGDPRAPNRTSRFIEAAQQHKDEAIKLWERLVNIDSQTGDEEGLKAVGAIATEELKKLGARIETVPRSPPSATTSSRASAGRARENLPHRPHGHRIAERHGGGAAVPHQGRPGHGPGVSDNKGGIIAALYVLRILQDLNFKDYAQITLLLNTNEETGSLGTRLLIEQLAKEHDVALNLEAGRPSDGLVVWRKGSGTIKVEVKGRAAHAGVAPDSGRNAAMELAHQILQLGKLGDRDKGTTVNFTVLKCRRPQERHSGLRGRGRRRAGAELRGIRPGRERELATTSQNKLIPDTEVTTSLTRLFPVMPQSAQTQALAVMAQAIYAELGKKLTLEGSGGAADSSFSAGVFKPTLDGLGPDRRQRPFARRICRARELRAPALPAHPHGDGAGRANRESVSDRRPAGRTARAFPTADD